MQLTAVMRFVGLVTYREIALLYDPDETSSLAQQRVAAVVSHEEAHMWFG